MAQGTVRWFNGTKGFGGGRKGPQATSVRVV